MDQPARKPGFTKPIGGFIVVLAVAVIVGAWLYVDGVKNDLEMKAQEDAARFAETERRAAEAPAAVEEVPEPETRTYAGELGGRRFQIDLPRGHHLELDEDGLTARVVSDSEAEPDHRYDITIMLVDPTEEPYVSYKPELGLRVISTDDARAAFWIQGWEDIGWSGFETVTASFKAL